MAINPITLKAQIDTEITNETIDFAITPNEVGSRMKDIIDYATENIVVKTKKVTLNSSQILNLFTTPIEVVPAISGKLLIIRQVFQKYTHITNAYTSNTWRIGYGSPSFGFVNLSPIITSASNSEGFNNISPSSSTSGGSFVGANLVVGATTSDPTGGDGILDLYITYYEITI